MPPLKARAWLDLVHSKKEGMAVDAKDIRKHKNDILRLSQLLSPSATVPMPQAVKSDMAKFLATLALGPAIDMKSLGIKHFTSDQVLKHLSQIYKIAD